MTSTRWLFASLLIVLGISSSSAQITDERSVSLASYGAAPGDQFAPVVATDGTDFLVAWIDARAIPVAIYANRVTPDGRVLDGTGIRIPVEQQNFPNGRLIGAFYVNGTYTVIYSYQSFASASFHTDAATISAEGRLIDGPRTILDDAYVTAGATNGSRIVLVAGNNVVVLNGRSEVIDRFGLSAVVPYGSAIASNGSTFLVGTFTYDGASNGVNLIALDANGKPVDETRIAASASGDGPIIGSDGSNYLVLYIDARLFKPVAQFVDGHAQIRSTTVIDGVPDSVARGAIVWTGRFYLVTATTADSDQQMELLRLDRKGTAITLVQPLGVHDVVNRASTAWNGSKVLLTWTSGSQLEGNAWDVVGALTNADATSISPVITIPSSSSLQTAPVITTSGDQDLIAWVEPTGIYATRITVAGTPLDGRGITVSSTQLPSRSLTLNGVSSLRAIYDGRSYLVAWGDYRGVTAQRLDPATGSLVGPAFVVAACTRSFDLVKDNESPVLFNADCSDGRVYAQRIGASGPVGAAVAISPPEMFADAPHAAWNGTEWLTVWHKLLPLPVLVSPPPYRAAGVYAARMSPALTTLDVQPIVIAESDFNEGSPIVASDGREFLVAWSHSAYNATDGVYVRRVQPDGSASEAEFLVPGPFSAAQSIIWNGVRYTIGYSRSDGYWNDDLFLTHVAPRKDDPLIRDEVTISATSMDERFVALTQASGRPVRVVYTRVATEPAYGGVSRVFMRDEITTLHRRSVRPR